MKRLLQSLFLMLFIAVQAWAQERTVTGTVTDKSDGVPLPGVSIKVTGTTVGTTTDANGRFSVVAPAGATTLTFSYIGYSAQTVAVSSSMTVTLSTDRNLLSEVVVTSFGVERSKQSLGYGTTQLSAEDLTQAKVTNVTNALAGKVAGVRVAGTGGAFTGSSVIIRGFTTFTGSNQPLYVVDGIPIDNGGGGQELQRGPSNSNRAIDINPEDIESMSVLKGAAATVLYGSRAASGVILITTKKGNRGEKNAISFSSSYNAGVVNRLPDYQNEYAQGNNGVYNPGSVTSTAGGLPLGGGTGLTTSWGPRITGQTVTNFFGQPEVLTAYPDNVKDIFQTADNFQNNISFSGGGDRANYRVSYGNLRETYVLDNNRMNRNNLSVNGSTQVTSKLTIGTSFSYVNSNSIRTGQGNQLSNPLFRAYFTPRSYDLTGTPFENANGEQLWYGGEDHPYWSMKYNKYDDDVNRVYGNVNARYNFNSWLSADVRVGTDFYNKRHKGFDEIGNRGGGMTTSTARLVGGIEDYENGVRNLNSYALLTATKKYGDFNFSLTAGNEITQNYSYSSRVYGYTLAVPGFDNLSNASSYSPSKGSTMTRVLGVFGDFVVDYKNFLTLNVKARNDWASTLTPANRSIFYPAVAASFVLTEAIPSLKDNKVIDMIKIRANVGEVGKGAGAYQTDTYYSKSTAADGFTGGIIFPYNGLTAFTLNNGAGQPDITPEFTREIELGGELAFFNNRLTIDGSYYNRKTRNVILSVPVSVTSGIGTVVKNAGRLSTKGVELLVAGTPIRSANFSWDLSVNFSQFKSMVDELAPGVSVITLGGFVTPNVRLVAGEEYGSLYGNAYLRNPQGQLIVTSAGLPQATSDVRKIGNPNAKYTAGIQNSFNYKGFSLSALLDIRKGGDQYSRNIADVQRNGVTAETAERPRYDAAGVLQNNYIYEGVYASGQPNTTMISSQLYYGNTGKYVAAEGFIFDTSWFRIREAALSYTFPKSTLTKTPFGNAEIGVFGRNLFLNAPNYPHFDPEQNALGIGNAQGLEFNSLPNTRTFGVNLRLTL